MSLITRCPACGTMFKVVPDQLRISEGWVRCGHCSDVFDASAHMQGAAGIAVPAPATQNLQPAAARASAVPPPPAPSVVEPRPSAPDPVQSPPAREPLPDPQWGKPAGDPPLQAPSPQSPPDGLAPTAAPVQPLGSAQDEPAGFAPDSQGVASTFSDSQVERNLYSLLLEEPDAPASVDKVPAPSPRTSARASRPSPLDVLDDDARDGPSSLDDATLDDISFVQQARRKAFWRRPLVRAVLSLAALALLGMLALQAAVHERDRIAAIEPRMRPLLERLCAQLHCTVGPLRQIESIVIDSSTFTKLRPDNYRLSFTVKNNASLPLAMPAIELALTDAADQPLVRRVLTPADMGAASPGLPPQLPAGGEWTGTFPLTVSGSGLRIVGYRLLAFYP